MNLILAYRNSTVKVLTVASKLQKLAGPRVFWLPNRGLGFGVSL